jgi:hypothetical protein
MDQAQRKPGKPGKPNQLPEPLPTVDGTEWGPAMAALGSDRHRAFVLALYQVPPGYGANVRAAKLSGFGTSTSSAKSWSVIASRLAHDEKILAALFEEDQKRIRASAPRAIRALQGLLEDSTHRDHGRAIGLVLERVHPAETTHMVKVQHDVTENFRDTAQVHARIAELTAKYRVALPAPGNPAPSVIDGEFAEVKMEAAR